MSTAKTTRILFLLDGSSSMVDAWSHSATRFQTAARILTNMADSIQRLNPNVEFGLRVFGHEHGVVEKNCYDTRLEVPFIKLAADQLRIRLQYLSPQGVSPIAYSLREAATNDFVRDNRYAYSIILLTDGGESCGGDICATMRELLNKKISFRPYIISLLDYAPLAQSYECMGKYLVVKNNEDIDATIKTIIKDNNNFEADENTRYIPPTPKVIISIPNTPAVAVVPPKVVVSPVSVTAPTPVNPPSPTPPSIIAPTPPRRQYIARLATSNFVRLGFDYWRFSTKLVALPKLVLEPFAEELVASTILRNAIQMAKISSSFTYKRQNSLLVLTDRSYVRAKPLPYFNFPIEIVPVVPIAVKPPPKPQTPAAPPEPIAVPGTFQLYFSNGNGKYYSTEPDIIIKDKQGKQAFRGFRSIAGSNGEPKPISLSPGQYTVSIAGNSSRNAGFTISTSQNTRSEIIVTRGTLSFGYEDNSKPEGYFALVSKRFESGPIIKQATDQELNYEPSNYHIEVNTLPPSLFNVDLVFDIGNMITLAKPGTVRIMNTDELGRIEFWYQLGDKYVPFFDMNIYGDIENQSANFKPGPYEVRYTSKDEQGNDVRRIKSFKIKKEQTTEITLTK